MGPEAIGELKDFAEALGGQETENFLRYSDRRTADNRCYFTGKLQLPEFYSSLRMVREEEEHCVARSDEYGVSSNRSASVVWRRTVCDFTARHDRRLQGERVHR